jgi:hypothetical protein
VLGDGTYEAIVVDVDEAQGGTVALSLTITDGPHKGEVVDVRATGLTGDPIGLLGLPATLDVREGRPTVRW